MDAAFFPGRLRELREAAGWTQQELADKAGLTREGVAQLEVGRRSPAWKTVLELCKALGVSCEEFQKQPEETTTPRAKGRPRKPTAEAEPTAEKTAKPRRRKKK